MHKLWKIEGNKRIDITAMASALTWNSNIDTLGVQLDFSIAFSDAKLVPKIDLTIGDIILLDNNGYEIFRGIVVTENRTGRDARGYTCFDFAFYLNKSKAIYQFNTSGNFEEVRFCGDNATHHKFTGWSGEGTITLTKVFSRGAKMMADAYKTGIMPEIKMISKLYNPQTKGAERVSLEGVVFTEFVVTKFENGAIVEDEIPFKFSDFTYLDTL